MTDGDDSLNEEDSLNEAVSSFRSAEEALNTLIEQAGVLRSAQDDLVETRTRLAETVEDSVRRLDSAQQSVADTTSAIFRLADDLRGIARDLGDTSQALIRLSPEELFDNIAAIQRDQNQLAERITSLADAHEEAASERQTRLSERITSLADAHEAAASERQEMAASQYRTRLWVIMCSVLIVATAILVIAV